MDDMSIKFLYRNYKGEYAERHVLPEEILYDEDNEYHGSCWVLYGVDLDKCEYRTFKLTDIVGFL